MLAENRATLPHVTTSRQKINVTMETLEGDLATTYNYAKEEYPALKTH